MIQFHALGTIAITADGAELSLGGARQRRLVAMLLIHRNEVVSVDRLAEAVFAGEPTAAARTTMRSYVARVRKVLENGTAGPTLVTQPPGYLLRLEPAGFDVAIFESHLVDSQALLSRGEATAAATTLRTALALWRGDPYAEFADEQWAMPEAQRLAELRLVASERLIEAELCGGRTDELLPEIEALTRSHPLREAFRVQLMTAYYRSGRQADALREMREFREELAEELGIDPSPELVDLEQRILRQDPDLQPSEPAGRPLRGYLLGERLGTGRDGVVYAARLPDVERDVVVRTIRAEVADDPGFVRSFEATAHRVASLRHPGVVPLHDYWREPGAAYVVMLRMPGGTLRDRLRRGPLSTHEIQALVERVGGSLAAAEEAGVQHGRITADSVLFDAGGRPCLSDFWTGQPDREVSSEGDVRQFVELLRECGCPDLGPGEHLRFAELVSTLRSSLTSRAADGGAELTNPYQGLRAFGESDAADFFGRSGLIDVVLERLSTSGLDGRILIVVGASGTGKSSVVRAGVLPRVRAGAAPGSENWFVTTMLPGGAPFKELAESLRRVAVGETDGLAEELAADHAGIDHVLRRIVPQGSQLLLVLDQFEELFTLSPPDEQRAFLDGLTFAAVADDSRVRLIATLRADYYHRPLAIQPFGDLVNQATVTITAMSPSDVEAAIVEPARRVGRDVERSLAAELVGELAKEPAALPALQFALFELAESSPDGRLTQAAYNELGGIEGAIAWRAEQLYRSLGDGERSQVRTLFEGLVRVGPEGEPTRRRATRAELSEGAPGQAIDDTIARWASARLLTLDVHPQTRVPTVELAHEALLREWPRLRGWIDEDRDAIIVRGRLREAASTWAELGREATALYRGSTLEAALESTPGHELTALEREFLDESSADRDRERQREAHIIAYQARTNRRLRRQLAFIGAALVIALVGGFVAVDQRRDAERKGHVAVARELAAAADSALDEDPERSILLGLAAIDATMAHGEPVLPEAHEALHRGVTSSRVVLSVPNTGGQLEWSADGKYFATEGVEETGIVDIRDARTGEAVHAFKGHDIDVNDVSFSADSRFLATTGDDSALKVWDVATGELRASHQGEGPPAWGAALSPEGSLVSASWGHQGLVRVIRVASGEVVSTIEGGHPLDTSFSPDGKRVAVTFGDEPPAVFEARSGRKLFTLGGAAGLRRTAGAGRLDVTWSPDGRWVAIGFDEPSARIFDARTGRFRFATAGHVAPVNGLDWSSDSRLLATASDDGTARLHELTPQGPRELLTLTTQDQRNGVRGVAFSADDRQLMTSDWRITSTKIWDISETGAAEWGSLSGRPATALAFAPDGESVYHPTAEGTPAHVDYATGTTLQTFGPVQGEPYGGGFVQLALSPDGRLLATRTADFPVHVWDTATGDLLFDVATPVPPSGEGNPWIGGMDWSSDGTKLAITINDFAEWRVEIYDTAGKRLNTIAEQGDIAFGSVSLSPDGRHVATTRLSPRDDPSIWAVRIWDATTGEVVREIKTPARTAVYDESGDRLLTTRIVGSVGEVWNARTGEKISTLIGHTGIIQAARFSRDGSSVATGSLDGSVRIWDPETGLFKQVLRGPTPSGVSAVAFSPNGTRLASTSHDGQLRVWALDLDDLIRMARDRLTRGMTTAECQQYLHVDRCPDA